MTAFAVANDNDVQVLGLRTKNDLAFLNTATVKMTMLDDLDGEEVGSPPWPVSLAYRDPGTSTMGGDGTTPTIIKSIGRYDLTVTVGATTALLLAAGDFLWIRHREDEVWLLLEDAAGAADGDVKLHVAPHIGADGKPPKSLPVDAVGEIVEFIDGIYEAKIDASIPLVDRTDYHLRIDITGAAGIARHWIKSRARADVLKIP